MNHGVGGVNQPVIIVGTESEPRGCQVSAKNSYSCLHIFIKERKVEVKLQRLPQTQLGLAQVTRPHQKVQGSAVILQQIGGHMGSDVAGRPGQEYRHVAPLVPVFAVSPFAGARLKLRGERASSGRPANGVYVQRLSAGICTLIQYSHQSSE